MATGSILWYLRSLAATREVGTTTDSDLLERFSLRHDQAAFDVLLARHGPMVWGVCRCMLADVHAAEDAFQATFLILVRKARSIGRRHLVGNWLYGVAHRVAGRARAQRLRRQKRECDGVQEAAARSSSNDIDRDLVRVVHEELNRLPNRYRGPLVLCYLQGKTREEAARQLGLTVGTVRGQLERGRERLRLQLLRRGYGLPAAALASVLFENCSAATVPAALFAATAKASWLTAAGTGIPLSVSILMEGAIHAMLIQKAKFVAFVVVGLGILSAGTSTFMHSRVSADQPAQEAAEKPKSDAAKQRTETLRALLAETLKGDQFPLFELTESERTALLTRFKGNAKQKTLLTEQLEAASTEYGAQMREFVAGRVPTMDSVVSASLRVLRAELDLCQTLDNQLASTETHFQRTKAVEKITQLRFDAQRVPIQEMSRGRYERARAELWLERLKTAEKMIPLGWWDTLNPIRPFDNTLQKR